MHLIEQWWNEVDLFAPKSDFCLICLILVHILLYKCCSILSEIVKIKLMIKKVLSIMPHRVSNDLFALKKCCILHIEH